VRLSEAAVGTKVRIVNTHFPPDLQNRILGLGFVPGSIVEVIREAPLGDPKVYLVKGKMVTLRNDEASLIEVEPVSRLIPLSMAEVGKRYVVRRFAGGSFFLSRMASLGIKLGSVVQVLGKYPIIILVNDKKAKLGMGMAEKILVEES